jgi:2-polyprenyl-3-methyl-5-hydroxy-6-metoxy-1,4-benzoquinol methylase
MTSNFSYFVTAQKDIPTTATAVAYWDNCWRHEQEQERWLVPESEVRNIIPVLRERRVKSVLDLGCGVGRHALFLASQGFSVFAMDGSSNGLAFARKEAERYNLTIDFRCSVMIDLPYEPETMDYILAWGVIYHGDFTVVRRCLRETYRVLCPGGLYHGTMLSKRNSNFGRGQEVAKDTFINNESEDKSHPHFYCNAPELVSLFSKVGFEVISLVDLPDSKPGSYHWHVLAEKV